MEREKVLRLVANVSLVMCVPLIVISLVYFCSQYYVNNEIIIANNNVSQYIIFAVATFILTAVSLFLSWQNTISIARIEILTREVMSLQELNIELQMRYKNQLISKVGEINE